MMKTKGILLLMVLAVVVLSGCQQGSKAGFTEISTGELATLQHDANLFQLIQKGYDSVPTRPPLPNHLYKEVNNGEFVFLHFDKAISQATKLFYTGRAVPGRFCKEDQDALPLDNGKLAFTHFHKALVEGDDATPEEGHGGEGGEEGFWFVHVAAAELDMPWGSVSPGVDYKFMPTPPPSCAELGIKGY